MSLGDLEKVLENHEVSSLYTPNPCSSEVRVERHSRYVVKFAKVIVLLYTGFNLRLDALSSNSTDEKYQAGTSV